MAIKTKHNFAAWSFATTLFFSISLLSREPVKGYPSPEQELEIIKSMGNTSTLPLSQALSELIQYVCDNEFDGPFFAKLEEAEENKFTGEYVDYWPNGELRIKANLIDGMPHEHVHGWFASGDDAFKAFFDHGKKIGVHFAFFLKDGTKKSSVCGRLLEYNRKGKLDGDQDCNYFNGQMKLNAEYSKGKLKKNYIFWSENGDFLSKGGKAPH